jgi:creatinine amidohydrolase
MSSPKLLWSDMTWTDFQAANAADWIAVLPVAAVEQHGPHLPLSTDADIMQGYLERAFSALPDDIPASLLPIQTLGLSPEHRDFPGTLTLSPETALRSWTEIGDSVARAGVRKLVLISSHGGNNGLLDIAARELRARHEMLAVTASFSRFGYPDDLFAPDEILHGIHGGEIETSLMLAFRPDLVRMDKLADFPAETRRMERDFKWLRAARPAGVGWMTQDLGPEGAIGNAEAATAAKGDLAADYGAVSFIELLRDVATFPLDRLRNGRLV